MKMQREVFCHEVSHIINDCPEHSYIVGLNMRNSSIERKDISEISKKFKKIFS